MSTNKKNSRQSVEVTSTVSVNGEKISSVDFNVNLPPFHAVDEETCEPVTYFAEACKKLYLPI